MKVDQIMTTKVKTCRADESLQAAAKAMWDGDCGCTPVVGPDERMVGMITDRDVCMSTYLSGRPLTSLKVAEAMSKKVHSCRPDDSLFAAESLMRSHQVRRLPVVDADEHLVGILSLNDIAREFEREAKSGARDVAPEEVAETLACVCEPREQEHLAAAN